MDMRTIRLMDLYNIKQLIPDEEKAKFLIELERQKRVKLQLLFAKKGLQ